MKTAAEFFTPGVALLLTVVFGFWMSRLGKPYNGILFNIHKLVALGGIILMVLQLRKVFSNTDPTAAIIALLVLAGICVIALFATGALMSLGKLDYALTLTIHRIAPFGIALASLLLIYLLGGRV